MYLPLHTALSIPSPICLSPIHPSTHHPSICTSIHPFTYHSLVHSMNCLSWDTFKTLGL